MPIGFKISKKDKKMNIDKLKMVISTLSLTYVILLSNGEGKHHHPIMVIMKHGTLFVK